MKIFKSIIFLLTLLSIASCSVEKRHYMSGYTINFKNKQHTETHSSKIITSETSESEEYPITSSGDNTLYLPSKSSTIKHLLDTCDIMELKNNSKVRIKIIEIRASDIKYRICGSQSDSAHVINKSEVIGIDFSNGLKGEFDNLGKLKPKKEKLYTTPKNEGNISKDSNYYNSRKIYSLPKGRFMQNNHPLKNKELWTLLNEIKKPEIDTLVQQSKKLAKKQKLGSLIIPLSGFLLHFPLLAIMALPITWTVMIVILAVCALAIIYLAIIAHRAKQKRWIIDREAVTLYNNSIPE